MAKKSGGKNKVGIIGYVMFALVIISFVMVIVSMFIGQVSVTRTSEVLKTTETTTYKLFDSDFWGVETVLGKEVGVSNAFGIAAVIITLVGAFVLAVDGVLRVFLKKKFKIIPIIAGLITLVGAVLILAAGLSMAGSCEDYLGIDAGKAVKVTCSAAAGVWIGFVFGLVAAAIGILSAVLKKSK